MSVKVAPDVKEGTCEQGWDVGVEEICSCHIPVDGAILKDFGETKYVGITDPMEVT